MLRFGFRRSGEQLLLCTSNNLEVRFHGSFLLPKKSAESLAFNALPPLKLKSKTVGSAALKPHDMRVSLFCASLLLELSR